MLPLLAALDGLSLRCRGVPRPAFFCRERCVDDISDWPLTHTSVPQLSGVREDQMLTGPSSGIGPIMLFYQTRVLSLRSLRWQNMQRYKRLNGG